MLPINGRTISKKTSGQTLSSTLDRLPNGRQRQVDGIEDLPVSQVRRGDREINGDLKYLLQVVSPRNALFWKGIFNPPAIELDNIHSVGEAGGESDESEDIPDFRSCQPVGVVKHDRDRLLQLRQCRLDLDAAIAYPSLRRPRTLATRLLAARLRSTQGPRRGRHPRPETTSL